MLTAPEVLKDVHSEFLKFGAGAITTNTFKTHERILKKVGIGHKAEELTKTAVEMAVAARDSLNPKALVMGCVSPLECCYKPEISPDTATTKKEQGEKMKQLLKYGVDFLLLEACCTSHESVAAAEVANELAPGYWGISFRLCPDGSVGML